MLQEKPSANHVEEPALLNTKFLHFLPICLGHICTTGSRIKTNADPDPQNYLRYSISVVYPDPMDPHWFWSAGFGSALGD
jgi:hypothetical protein